MDSDITIFQWVTSTTSSLRSMSSLLKTVLFLWKSLGKGLLIFWMTGLYIDYQRSELMCGVSLVLNAWSRRYSMGELLNLMIYTHIKNPKTYITKVLTSEILFLMLLRNVGDSFLSLKGSVREKWKGV